MDTVQYSQLLGRNKKCWEQEISLSKLKIQKQISLNLSKVKVTGYLQNAPQTKEQDVFYLYILQLVLPFSLCSVLTSAVHSSSWCSSTVHTAAFQCCVNTSVLKHNSLACLSQRLTEGVLFNSIATVLYFQQDQNKSITLIPTGELRELIMQCKGSTERCSSHQIYPGKS